MLRLEDSARSRPIQLDVWYPTPADEAAHRYGLRAGFVARDAPMAAGVFPAALLSHGALGAAAVSRFGARTRDLSFALDFVLQRSKWASAVDGARVGAIGHSSGGATITMLAGGRYRPEAMAVGPAFDQPSLAHVTRPALVAGSVDNDFLPFEAHAGRYASLLPDSELLRLETGAGHVVYLDECLSTIEVMGVGLCTERPGVVRKDVHARLSARILAFLNRHLGAASRPSAARSIVTRAVVR